MVVAAQGHGHGWNRDCECLSRPGLESSTLEHVPGPDYIFEFFLYVGMRGEVLEDGNGFVTRQKSYLLKELGVCHGSNRFVQDCYHVPEC